MYLVGVIVESVPGGGVEPAVRMAAAEINSAGVLLGGGFGLHVFVCIVCFGGLVSSSAVCDWQADPPPLFFGLRNA